MESALLRASGTVYSGVIIVDAWAYISVSRIIVSGIGSVRCVAMGVALIAMSTVVAMTTCSCWN